MPGVSSRMPCDGADGVGKVRFRFRHKDEKKKSKIGVVVFLTCFAMIIFSYSWSKVRLRQLTMLPFMRRTGNVIANMVSLSEKNVLVNVTDEITVDVDMKGTVYVHAKTTEDLLFQQGYIHARSRLFQMDYSRRVGSGRLSELFGAKTESIDKFSRSLGLMRAAKTDIENLDDEELSLLERYSSGVNSYLHSSEFMVPVEYWLVKGVKVLYYGWGDKTLIEDWTPLDTLLLMRLQSFEQSHGWEEELLKWFLRHSVGHHAAKEIQLEEHHNWTAAETDTGHTIHNDDDTVTILPSFEGNVWAAQSRIVGNLYKNMEYSTGEYFLMNLHSPQLHVSGASLPGVPFIQQGHNDAISWTSTPSTVDTADIVIQEFEELDNYKVQYEDGTIDLISAHRYSENFVTCNRTFFTNACSVISFDVLQTVSGPVISDSLHSALQTGISFTLLSPALNKRIRVSTLLKLNQATNFAEFKAALSGLQTVSLNFVYLDTAGTTGYVTTGSLPPRLAHDVGHAVKYGKDLPIDLFAAREAADHVLAAHSYPAGHSILLTDMSSESISRFPIFAKQKSAAANAIARLENYRNNVYSPSAMKLLALAQEVRSNKQDTVDEVIMLEKIAHILTDFDGHYSIGEKYTKNNADSVVIAAPTLLESFRLELISALLAPLGASPLASTLYGAGFTSIPTPKSLSRFGLWIFPLLESNSAFWVQRIGREVLLKKSLLRAFRRCENNFGLSPTLESSLPSPLYSAKPRNESVAPIDLNGWDWGHAHQAVHSSRVKSSPILEAAFGEGAVALPGTIDSIFRSPYKLSEHLSVNTEYLQFNEKSGAATHLQIVMNAKQWDESKMGTITGQAPLQAYQHGMADLSRITSALQNFFGTLHCHRKSDSFMDWSKGRLNQLCWSNSCVGSVKDDRYSTVSHPIQKRAFGGEEL